MQANLSRISRDVARSAMSDMLVHDDGVQQHGGQTVFITGPLGSGKTTLALTIAGKVACIPSGVSKKDAFLGKASIVPETVIWRGRKYDYWNTLEPRWFRPFTRDKENGIEIIERPIRVHSHINDTLAHIFTEDQVYEIIPGKEISFSKYSSVDDLYNNILPGGLNVVYEPTTYILPPLMVQKLKAKLLKPTSFSLKGSVGVNQNGRRRMIGEGVVFPSPVWWFEFLERLQELKRQDEFFTQILDESHEIFPVGVNSIHWYLVEWFAHSVIDTRRKNVSIFSITHAPQLVDYRVFDRSQFFVWLRGSHPPARVSMIKKFLPGSLSKGEALIERPNIEFGLLSFRKVPQAPVIFTEGLEPKLQVDPELAEA